MKKEEGARMLLIYFPILSTTINSPLPKPWVLGKTLYSSPCVVIPWLQLHRDLERKSYWLLVLFITHTWMEMKHKGSKQGQLSHNTVCSVTQYKRSDTSITYRQLGQLSFTSGACFLNYPLFQYVLILGHCSGTGNSSWASSVKNQMSGNFEQVQYFRPLNSLILLTWEQGRGRKKKNKMKSHIAEWEKVKKLKMFNAKHYTAADSLA